MKIILITGISGSGKSIALNALEDAGIYCVDNLPPALLGELVATRSREYSERLAVAVDSRSAGSLTDLPRSIDELKLAGHDVTVLFLTADTHTLITRYSETRRAHPLSHANNAPENPKTLFEAILEERELMSDIQVLSHVIDTTNSSANELRKRVKEFAEIERSPLTIHFESFGFKFGVPLDADFVFDVRCLPNPFYDRKLRPLTGLDKPVCDFLRSQPDVIAMADDITLFVKKWLPAFYNDNRSYLTVAIGCTGGCHRSVYLVEEVASRFAATQKVITRHRELQDRPSAI